ncbi:MAG: hypothetical protein RLZ44_40 [Pseudomonadota bacterium]|jgi:Ala-tRNA(Pro) deacylase
MAIAVSLRRFLDAHHLPHEQLTHGHAESGQRTAAAAHRPGDKVAKSVLLKGEEGFLLAVLPATHRLHFSQLRKHLQRPVGLATEEETATLFEDCAVGAIPPTGLLYDVDTIVDDALLSQPDVYFEAGDHEHLIHMRREDFSKLLGDATHGRFSYHA